MRFFFPTGDDNILLALPTNFYLDFRQNNLQDITLIDCENSEFILTFLPSENILSTWNSLRLLVLIWVFSVIKFTRTVLVDNMPVFVSFEGR